MTTFRIPRQRAPEYERGTRLCPVCWQLAGEPCRAVLARRANRKGGIRVGKPLAKMHAERRGDSTGDPGKLPPKPKPPVPKSKQGLGFVEPRRPPVERPS